jgi:hypothetical protein
MSPGVAAPGQGAGLHERREVVGQPDDQRRHAEHGRVERDGRVHRDHGAAGHQQRRQRRLRRQHRTFGWPAARRRVDVRRLGRMRLDGQMVRPPAAAAIRSRQHVSRLLELRDDQPERLAWRHPAACRAASSSPAGSRRAASTRASSRGLPVTTSDAGGNRPPLEVPRGVRVEQQRAVRPREAAVRPAGRIRLHLVRLVQVVEPVPVDEPVLQPGRGNGAPPRLEHQRPSPAARLGVGQHDRRLERVERGAGFVHRARRPGPLEQRDAGQLLADERPAVAAADHGVLADVAAGLERSPGRVTLPPDLAATLERAERRERLDRLDGLRRAAQRVPPAPGPEVRRRADADQAQPPGGSAQPARRARGRCTTRRRLAPVGARQNARCTNATTPAAPVAARGPQPRSQGREPQAARPHVHARDAQPHAVRLEPCPVVAIRARARTRVPPGGRSVRPP